jgi:hypothetical protein
VMSRRGWRGWTCIFALGTVFTDRVTVVVEGVGGYQLNTPTPHSNDGRVSTIHVSWSLLTWADRHPSVVQYQLKTMLCDKKHNLHSCS